MGKFFRSDGSKILLIESGQHKTPTFLIFGMPKLLNSKIERAGIDSKLTLEFLFNEINHYSTTNISEVSARFGEMFSRENLLKLVNADIDKKVETPNSISELDYLNYGDDE